jgi:hypothetical protein
VITAPAGRNVGSNQADPQFQPRRGETSRPAGAEIMGKPKNPTNILPRWGKNYYHHYNQLQSEIFN